MEPHCKKTIEAIRAIAPDVKIIIGGIFNSSIYGLSLLEKPYDENIIFTFHCYSPLVFTHQKAYWIKKMPKDYVCPYPLSHKEMSERSHEIFGSDFDSEFDDDSDELLGADYFKNLFSLALMVSKKYDVPLYCGEYGFIDQTDCFDGLRWLKDIHQALENENIPRALWTYKKKDFGLIDEHYAPVIDEMVKYL